MVLVSCFCVSCGCGLLGFCWGFVGVGVVFGGGCWFFGMAWLGFTWVISCLGKEAKMNSKRELRK